MPINPHQIKHNQGLLVFLLYKIRVLFAWVSDINLTPDCNKNYIFVVGCGHSGTTLLAARLGNHDQIHVIPKETGWFLPKRSLRMAKIKMELEMSLARKSGKKILLEKSPKHVHCIQRILQVYPHAKIVIVSRNSYDAIASLRKRFNFELAVQRWLIDTRPSISLMSNENCFFVKYEDITMKSADTFSKLLKFLELNENDAVYRGVANAYSSQHFDANSNMLIRQQQVSRPITPRVKVFKNELTDEEITNVTLRCKLRMKELGYEIQDYL